MIPAIQLVSVYVVGVDLPGLPVVADVRVPLVAPLHVRRDAEPTHWWSERKRLERERRRAEERARRKEEEAHRANT